MTRDDARQAHLDWWMRENAELVTPENREVLTAAIDSAFGAGVLSGSERMMAKVSDAEIGRRIVRNRHRNAGGDAEKTRRAQRMMNTFGNPDWCAAAGFGLFLVLIGVAAIIGTVRSANGRSR